MHKTLSDKGGAFRRFGKNQRKVAINSVKII